MRFVYLPLLSQPCRGSLINNSIKLSEILKNKCNVSIKHGLKKSMKKGLCVCKLIAFYLNARIFLPEILLLMQDPEKTIF